MEQEEQILDFADTRKPVNRKQLLPWWVKLFSWIFMLMGAAVPAGFVAGLLGVTYEVSVYGLTTYHPLSYEGILLSVLFLFKGITAFGLISEKEWAVNFAIADAWAGIAICGFMTLIYPFLFMEDGIHFNFRLELLLLIPYLVKMMNIQKQWRDES